MDLVIGDEQPTAEERDALDRLLGPASTAWLGGERRGADLRTAHAGAEVRGRRHLLLPALQALVERVGYVSRGGLAEVCRRLTVPPADAYGVVTFYEGLPTEPRPRTVLHVCTDLACRAPAGEGGVGDVHVTAAPCLGLCEVAPAALLVRHGADHRAHPVGHVDAAGLGALLAGGDPPAWSTAAAVRRAGPLLARVAAADPTDLDAYLARGGYGALRRAVEIGAEEVVAEIERSGLLGRGGAAFPTGRKWAAVAAAADPVRHVVVNADESEPGTFKDRVVLEGDPFAVIEAATIAGITCGATSGYVYLRGEYPVARERLTVAIRRAYDAGLLGDDVARSGRRFDLELRLGAGAYICGEETALFNSLEGYRGEPRSKPPFPVEVGLFGRPTVVNNVETLLNVRRIVEEGADRWASTETKLFCVSGAVDHPGLYEVPVDHPLGDLLEEAGVTPTLQAVLLGGAAGTFLPPDALDLPLGFDAARAAGATLGSGVVFAVDRSTDLTDLLGRIARFFRHESCGQCVPCRVGTVRQEEVLDRLRATRSAGQAPDPADLVLLGDLAAVLRDASICGLGQTAASAISSAMVHLRPFGATTEERP